MSKLNPQKATAYVGPGVLRKGGKITPVPNGPLVKKKGQFKGSTLRSGGTIKKTVRTISKDKTSVNTTRNFSKDVSGERILTAKKNKNYENSLKQQAVKKRKEASNADMLSTELMMSDNNFNRSKIADKLSSERNKSADSLENLVNKNKKNPRYKPALKTGGMIKRADGSMSKRGLWDNLRSKAAQNKKTGAKPKAPTRAMLTQEKKIKAKK
jgi:hypothetical protein